MADDKKAVGITVKKDEDTSEWYAQVIQKAELIEYTQVSGCYVLRPRAFAMWETAKEFLDTEIKKRGVKNTSFPIFIPENLLTKEAQHVEGFAPEVAWVTQGGKSELPERLAVRPTSETIMYDAFAKWIKSHRDLPLEINQWCNIVRWEFKHPTPFLRTREFLWQEGHTAHATEKQAWDRVYDILDLYHQVFKELFAIPTLKGIKSEKEKFAGGLATTSVETFLPNGKAIQGATSHNLGQNFAKAFDISFLDEEGNTQLPWQTSWGFTTRSIGMLILFHGDDKGLVLPPRLAPEQVAIVPILFEDSKQKVLDAANKIKEGLQDFRVVLDDRDGYTPGWKFNNWEMKGACLRIEIGPKDVEKDSVVIVRRDTGKKEFVKTNEIKERVTKLLDDMQQDLYDNAKKRIDDAIVDVTSWDDFMNALGEKKLIRAPWCADVACEEAVKDKSGGAKSLNIPFDQEEKEMTCIQCSNKATKVAFFAKSY